MIMDSVLLVDDDEKLLNLLKNYFEKDCFITYIAVDGVSALAAVHDYKPNLVVLDVMMPGIDGWKVCQKIREDNNVPIIMLTACNEEKDRVFGFELGADDYVTKPFSPKELVARAKVILKRVKRNKVYQNIINLSDLTINIDSHQVIRAGENIELTAMEFKILEVMIKNPEKVFSRSQISEQIHKDVFEGSERTIDVHIKNLRRKLEKNSKSPVYIETIYGIGYKIVEVKSNE